MKEIITITTKKEFRAGLPKILELAYSSEENKKKMDIQYLLTTLQDVCYSIQCEGQHIVIIDGLDDVLTKRNKQYVSLSSLILAADRVNRKLKGNKVKAKIVILCRTDLFERLPSPNKNKIKQDSAVILDWYQDVKDIKSTNLIKLINLRTALSLKKDIDIFELLPQSIQDGTPLAKTLVDYTRHTPRDIVQLLNKVQDHLKDKKSKERNPTSDTVKNGLRTYSFDYLVPEIKDELEGYLTKEEIENVILLLGSMKNNRFSYKELETQKNSDARFKSVDLQKIIPILFDCNAIGNVNPGGYHSWKFRNRYSYFNPNEDIEIHRGLRKGLNLP